MTDDGKSYPPSLQRCRAVAFRSLVADERRLAEPDVDARLFSDDPGQPYGLLGALAKELCLFPIVDDQIDAAVAVDDEVTDLRALSSHLWSRRDYVVSRCA